VTGGRQFKKTKTMTDKELDEAIAAQPYEKVTKDHLESLIDGSDYHIIPNSTVTICNLRLRNGFSVRGESSCVDARNFNMEIGRQIAYRNAFSKLWELEGYLLAERRYLRSKRGSQEILKC
jgi:hypothetical protein